MKLQTQNQNINWKAKDEKNIREFFLEIKGSIIYILTERNKAITPPNFLGIERNIA